MHCCSLAGRQEQARNVLSEDKCTHPLNYTVTPFDQDADRNVERTFVRPMSLRKVASPLKGNIVSV